MVVAVLLGAMLVRVSGREMRARAELVAVKAQLAEAQTDAETYARGLRECEAK